MRRPLGCTSRIVLIFKTYLAKSLNAERRYPEAENLARETYEIQRRVFGPQHIDTIDTSRELGEAMAYTHRFAEANKLFQDLIRDGSYSAGQGNRWSMWYAFACVAAVAAHTYDALQFLHGAINRGYKNVDGLMADDDLKSLRRDSRFQQIVNKLRRSPASLHVS